MNSLNNTLRTTCLKAAQVVEQGGLIAYPTDTVWGLGCDPLNRDALQRLLDVKERSWHKGLIVMVSQWSQIAPLLSTDLQSSQADLFAPTEPTTWLLPVISSLPNLLIGDHSTLAVRFSDAPIVKVLCEAINGPLVSTSANKSDHPLLTSLAQIKDTFGSQIDYYVPGGELKGQPSIIRDFETGEILR